MTNTTSTHAGIELGEELDLVIPGMEGAAEEQALQDILGNLAGVQAALIIPEGAWIRYDPELVTKEGVCNALTDAGFRPSLFQDSLSGEAHNFEHG